MKLIGDTMYYQLTDSAPMKQRLVCVLEYSTGTRRPCQSLHGDYLTIWRATNGVGFCVRAGFQVVNATIRHDMSLAQFCSKYSDMRKSTICDIEAFENSHS